jgi:hypothetical protein
VPASNTAVGHIILENRSRGAKTASKAAGRHRPAPSKHKRAAARAKVHLVRG